MITLAFVLLSAIIIAALVFLIKQSQKISLLEIELKHLREDSLINTENLRLNFEKDVKHAEESYTSQVEFLESTQESELKELESLFKTKTTEYEKSCDEYEKFIDTFQRYYLHLSNIIHVSDQRIKLIDAKGLFKSDDEIGFFFDNIKEIQATLNEFDFTKPETRYKPKPIAAPSPIDADGNSIYEGGIYIPPEKVQELIREK